MVENMKKLLQSIVMIILSFLTFSCKDMVAPENNDVSSEEIESVEEIINFIDGVILYDSEMKDYIRIIDDNTICLSMNAPQDKVPEVGDIIVYNPEDSVTGVFIGRVKSIQEEGNTWVIKTETPSMEDVFEDLSINLEMGAHNTTAIYQAAEGDNITSCRVVDNSVWDDITVLYDEAGSARVSLSTKADAYKPVDVTVEVAVNNKAFEGKIYIGMQGFVYIKNLDDFVMNVSTRIGLNGTLGVGAEGDCEIPLLQVKNGITLWTNKMLALRLKPQLLFLSEGKIRVESGLNYELMNTDIRVSHSKADGFRNNSVENKHDNYFRLKSLHTEGKFGLAVNGDLYAVLLSENFFKGGADLRAGITLGGEKNVGIQFPGIANFDFKVLAEPFVSMQPFVAHRSAGGLSLVKGPELKASVEAFRISLLPDIHKVEYKLLGEAKLGVNAEVKGSSTSLVVSKQEGIALFKKGEEEPVKRERVMEISAKAEDGEGVSFKLEDDQEYEIAVYVESEKDGFIYGERIDIEKSLREVLEEFYRSTNGDNWLRNDNWCTDAPLYEWYGVSPLHDEETDVTNYSLYLSGNNLSGNAYLGPNGLITEVAVADNELSGLEADGCSALTYLSCSRSQVVGLELADCSNLTVLRFDGCPLEYVNIARCGLLEEFNMFSWNEIKPLGTCSFSFSDCGSLKEISVFDIDLVELNLSGIPALESLSLIGTQLSSLSLSDYPNLSNLYIENNNNLTSLDLSNLPALDDGLDCHSNKMETVSVINCTKLDEILLHDNPVVSLNLSGCSNLDHIHSDSETISLINICGCSKLRFLDFKGSLKSSTLTVIGDSAFTGSIDCIDGNLTSLDVSSCSGLTGLDCSDNSLTSLDVSGCSSLMSLVCYNNPLTSLNVSGCSALKYLECYNTHLNMQITDFYQNLEYFGYDRKYTDYYWTGYNNKTLHYTTNPYGWWYPGEPERGYH